LPGLILIAGVASRAGAQVGYPPDRSPYRDLEFAREWTAFTGYYAAQPDPVGVAPQSGTMFGLRYDARVGGPAYVSARLAGAVLKRNVLDPRKPIDERAIGSESVPLLFSDLNLNINLTGYRTWRGLAPFLSGGFGITADLRGRNDVGDYRFGAPVTLTFGAGFKWIPRSQWQLRVDWSNYLYKIRYPESYFLRTGADDPVRLPDDAHSLWRRNTAIQVGISYLYRR
jgi:hypothetical protein